MSENATVFDPSKLNIVTTPFYQRWIPGSLKWTIGDPVTPDVVEKARGDLAIRTIHAGAEKGARVIVVDGANNRPFRQAIKRGNIYIYGEEIRGMSAGRQQGFRIAASIRMPREFPISIIVVSIVITLYLHIERMSNSS